ncbi:ZapG family protein [Pleionea litopenaei]|uniref:Z-ring associated protein G n=1 Tax=Pleionea litopenaei TaxID=3070815 RepID=A0AA51RT03_9GAMM|nr:DUF1043 family protein [Pleionea sp. HL-JVS1]WMS87126.1 DUF1043 family protein [Pleionea sp. HL-JVS1]
MEWLIGLVVVGVTAAVAYSIGKRQAPSHKKIEQLENLVVEKDRELQNFQAKVNHHFETSADLFTRVTNDYQELYNYMAKSSAHLGGSQAFKNALENQSQQQYLHAHAHMDDEFKGEDTFSNESFYHAHEYRNSDDTKEEEEATKIDVESDNSADIIHLDKQKEKSGEPPLDYAVKEKGVINHNSLNMENVKT